MTTDRLIKEDNDKTPTNESLNKNVDDNPTSRPQDATSEDSRSNVWSEQKVDGGTQDDEETTSYAKSLVGCGMFDICEFYDPISIEVNTDDYKNIGSVLYFSIWYGIPNSYTISLAAYTNCLRQESGMVFEDYRSRISSVLSSSAIKAKKKLTAQDVLRKFGAFILSGGWIVEIAVVISFFSFNIRSSQNWVTFIGPIFACFCLFCLSTPGARSSIFAQITNSRVATRTCSGSISLTAYVIHALVLGYDVYELRVAKKMAPPAGLIWLFTISILCDRYLVDLSRKFVNSVLRHLGSAVKWVGSQEERLLLIRSFVSKKCREIICLARFQFPLESASDLIGPTSSFEVVN